MKKKTIKANLITGMNQTQGSYATHKKMVSGPTKLQGGAKVMR
jgi:hypothetical protein